MLCLKSIGIYFVSLTPRSYPHHLSYQLHIPLHHTGASGFRVREVGGDACEHVYVSEGQIH